MRSAASSSARAAWTFVSVGFFALPARWAAASSARSAEIASPTARRHSSAASKAAVCSARMRSKVATASSCGANMVSAGTTYFFRASSGSAERWLRGMVRATVLMRPPRVLVAPGRRRCDPRAVIRHQGVSVPAGRRRTRDRRPAQRPDREPPPRRAGRALRSMPTEGGRERPRESGRHRRLALRGSLRIIGSTESSTRWTHSAAGSVSHRLKSRP